jgi:hypothetical protein
MPALIRQKIIFGQMRAARMGGLLIYPLVRAISDYPEMLPAGAGALSGCAAAKLGWIVVAGGVVVLGRRKDETWADTLTVANDDIMSRFEVMHPCGVGRSTEGDQKTQGQNRTHRILLLSRAQQLRSNLRIVCTTTNGPSF